MKENSIQRLYDLLLDFYGKQNWWPCRSGDRWEIVAGAVLTQNCSWNNVEKALINLETARLVTAEKILSTNNDVLQNAIRPAGFFKQKAVYLKALAEFFIKNEEEFLQSSDFWSLRKRLLAVKGVGRETADEILLYAFQKPVFVIDAYTRRVAERHLHLNGLLPYDNLQKVFMEVLPSDVQLYGEYHALIIALGKDSCQKAKCGKFCEKIDDIL